MGAKPEHTASSADRAVLGNGETVALASASRRVAARLIDAVLGWLVASAVAIGWLRAAAAVEATQCTGDEYLGCWPLVSLVTTPFVWLVVALWYETGFSKRSGASFGKQMLRLRVVRVSDGTVSMGRIIARSLLLPLGFTFPFVQTKQGLHDRAAGTLVVSTPSRKADDEGDHSCTTDAAVLSSRRRTATIPTPPHAGE